MLADDVVFHSPVVFTPQKGKRVVAGYLTAAKHLLAGDHSRGSRYTSVLYGADTAVLEFETTVGGTYVNGIDIIRTDETGRIVSFKVFIRPRQAIEVVHDQMRGLMTHSPHSSLIAGRADATATSRRASTDPHSADR